MSHSTKNQLHSKYDNYDNYVTLNNHRLTMKYRKVKSTLTFHQRIFITFLTRVKSQNSSKYANCKETKKHK